MLHTAINMSWKLFILVCLTIQVATSLDSLSPASDPWYPIPQKQYPYRPSDGAPFCQTSGTPFCSSGLQKNYMPTVGDADELFVYAMKAPATDIKVGKFMHDAIGFHHVQSGLNLTMEWSGLFQLFNCTFPQEPHVNPWFEQITWCNQGASCVSPGIDANHWRKDGLLAHVATINGSVFNHFANWTEHDNNTYPFYQTWKVHDNKEDGTVWFDAFDGASWVLRAFDALHSFGAEFNTSIQLNYTRLELISEEPEKIGNPSGLSPTYRNLVDFYSHFQKYKTVKDIGSLFTFLVEFLIIDRQFYLYFNGDYYLLPLKYPFIKVSYDAVALPGLR